HAVSGIGLGQGIVRSPHSKALLYRRRFFPAIARRGNSRGGARAGHRGSVRIYRAVLECNPPVHRPASAAARWSPQRNSNFSEESSSLSRIQLRPISGAIAKPDRNRVPEEFPPARTRARTTGAT